MVIKLMDFGMNFRVKWMFEEDWKEDTLDRLGRKVMRMVMPVMLVLVPMLLLILPPLQTNTAQVQRRRVLGRGHAGQVWQEGEEDGDASNAGARASAAVDIAAATDQYSSGTASRGTGRRVKLVLTRTGRRRSCTR